MKTPALKLIAVVLSAGIAGWALPGYTEEAPVIDDSANYALSQSQDEAFMPEKPVKQVEQDDSDWQQPLAQTQPNEKYAETQQESDDNVLLSRLHALEQEVQQLRGQLEVQAHDFKLLQQQQLAFYKDLDSRLSKGSSAEANTNKQAAFSLDDAQGATSQKELQSNSLAKPQAKAPTKTSTKLVSTNPADEQLSYVAAYELVKTRQFDKAQTAMEQFIQDYPSSQFAPNAHYWLGELYMLKRQFLFASREFSQVIKQFPKSTKVAASQLKLAYAYVDMGNIVEAKQQLQQVIQQYPDTSTAQLAKRKLSQLNGNG